MKTIEIECASCGGTGLYRGRGERKGAAVICRKCHGTGSVSFSYNEFTGRKHCEGVTRVFKDNCGVVISAEDTTLQGGQTIHFSQYGCSYEDWLAGKPPTPIKELLCPHLAFHQPVPNCAVIRTGDKISDCPHYPNKAACWLEYEKLHGPV
jgi:hypothetical protein